MLVTLSGMWMLVRPVLWNTESPMVTMLSGRKMLVILDRRRNASSPMRVIGYPFVVPGISTDVPLEGERNSAYSGSRRRANLEPHEEDLFRVCFVG